MDDYSANLDIASRWSGPLRASIAWSHSVDVLSHAIPAARAMPAESVRSFEPRDIPDVCRLFLETFRDGKTRRADDLAGAIEATYLRSPTYCSDTGSIVHLDARGRVNGFLGVINIDMCLGDRRLRAGVLSAYMADRHDANPAIGVRLVRAVVSRPLDLIFTDTANRTSLDISRALRFSVLPAYSLEWMKLLRPVGTAAYWLGRHRPRLRRWVEPVAGMIDARLPRLRRTLADERSLKGTIDRPVAVADFVARAPRYVAAQALRPAWHPRELAWLMTQAGLRTKNGPLHVREVLDRSGRPVGLYLLYAGPGSVAFALQILADPGCHDMVVSNLIEHAKRMGAVAVRGTTSPEIVQGLLRQPGIVYRNVMTTITRTSDPEIALALRTGNVFLGGLAGETWTRVFSDEFS